MAIEEFTRGHIVFSHAGKTVTIYGEAYLPGCGSPDFVVYSNSISNWDPPDDDLPIDEETKREILQLLHVEMEDKGLTMEVE